MEDTRFKQSRKILETSFPTFLGNFKANRMEEEEQSFLLQLYIHPFIHSFSREHREAP